MLKNKCKNFIIVGLTSSLLLISTSSFAANTGVINTETVKLRSKASTDSSVVTLVSEDEKVEIIEKDGEWYKVKYKEKTGYIYAKYVDSKEETQEQSTQNTTNENTTEQESTDKPEDNTEQQNENEQTPNEESEPQTNSNTTENTNLEISTTIKFSEETQIRLIPLINSSVVSTIPANTQAVILDYVNGWYYITTDTISGWVREEKVPATSEVKQEEQPTETEEEQEKEEEETNITKYTSEKVNLRKEASSNGDIIKTIEKNTKVTVTGTEGEWSKVTIDGETGYISSKYLSDKEVKEETSENKITNRSLEEQRTEENSTSSKQGGDVVTYAKKYLGTRYVLGGETPSRGFDCSGFTRYIYKQYGTSLAHSASAQAGVGTKVEKKNLQPGDLVIFNNDANTKIGHVGIYIGGNNFIHASNPSDGVKITSMSTGYYSKRYVTARRVL